MPLFNKERRKQRKQKRKERRQERKTGLKLTALLPFHPIMVKMLRKRGYPAKLGIKNLAKNTVAFNEIVINKKQYSNYEYANYDFVNPENPLHPLNNAGGNYEQNNIEFPYNQYYEVNNAEASTEGGGGKVTAEDVAKFAATSNVVLQLADKIVNFVKNIIAKKDAGQNLSETEREISETAKETPTTDTTTEGGLLTGNMPLIIGAVVVLFLVFRK